MTIYKKGIRGYFVVSEYDFGVKLEGTYTLLHGGTLESRRRNALTFARELRREGKKGVRLVEVKFL